MRSSRNSQEHCSRSQGSLGPGDQQQGQELATEESRAAHGTEQAKSQQQPSFHRGATVLKPDCYWDESTSTGRLVRDGQMKWGKIKLNETGGEKRYQTGGICGAFYHLTLLSYQRNKQCLDQNTHGIYSHLSTFYTLIPGCSPLKGVCPVLVWQSPPTSTRRGL